MLYILSVEMIYIHPGNVFYKLIYANFFKKFIVFKIALAIRGFLYFHTNLEIICSSSAKNVAGSLIVLMRWVKLEPIIQGRHCHLPKFHIYVLVHCIGVFLSGLLHSV